MSMYLEVGYMVEYQITYPDGHSSSWNRWRQTKVYDSSVIDNTVAKLNLDFRSVLDDTQYKYTFRKRTLYINLSENE